MEQWQILIITIVIIYFIFRNKIWGWLDPLFLFLAIRIATAIVVAIQFTFDSNLIGRGTLHLILCLVVFITSLWIYSPKTNTQIKVKTEIPEKQVSKLLNIGLLLLICKIAIMSTVYNELPIFSGEKGSDSYISFDVNNKLISSLILGLGSSDIIILACVVPLLEIKKEKYIGRVAFFISVLIAVAALKKSALIGVIFSVAFGEYLRHHFFKASKNIYIKPHIIFSAALLAVAWAYYVYISTSKINSILSINDILNFAPFQFMHVYTLYASGIIYDFSATYLFNPFLYFFHSILSPLGFPAFSASIGPALHEYLTGDLSGNGVNPTYIVEGYIVFGWYLALYYAAFLGWFLGFARRILLRRLSYVSANKIALCALLLPLLYTVTIDALLAIKQFIVCLFVILMYLFIIQSKRCLTIISKSGNKSSRVETP